MKSCNFIIIGFLLFMVSEFQANSQTDDFKPVNSEAEFSSKMKEYAAGLKTIKSDFKQVKHLQYLDAALESGGKFWFKSPDKVRWEYLEPYKYTLILNSGKLSMISENSSNEFDMNGNAIFEQINNLIIASVSGNIFEIKDYHVNTMENPVFFLVVLKPSNLSISSMISQMELYVDKKSYAVTKIKMTETSSDYSIISFFNLKINEGIEDKNFMP